MRKSKRRKRRVERTMRRGKRTISGSPELLVGDGKTWTSVSWTVIDGERGNGEGVGCWLGGQWPGGGG